MAAGPAGIPWERVAVDAPEGLAVVDAEGRFVQVNRAGARLCGRAADDLVGLVSPFSPAAPAESGRGEPAQGDGEQVGVWCPAPGLRRELAYRTRRAADAPGLTSVSFRDATEERHRRRRLAALARTAAALPAHGSPTATLDALAAEVLRVDTLAGVEILVLDESGGDLRVVGTAGFGHRADFFDRLAQVERCGGTLRMREALRDGVPVVVPNRWTAIRDDPVWAPLHDYHTAPAWDSFASVPLLVRGRVTGVLNAFFAPGQPVGRRTVEFLTAMAEQAALAVDYRRLLRREREQARREERRRLARDLHDSVVQQVFSIGMQTKALELLTRRGEAVPAEAVRRAADEVGLLARTALADLEAMVQELRPPSRPERDGIEETVRALAESIERRTGLRFRLSFGPGLDLVRGEMAEDVHRIVAEAVHNAVKHAEARTVAVRLAVREGSLSATVSDDGRGIAAADHRPDGERGFGLGTMRERAERWGGSVRVGPRRGRGTAVRLTMPLRRQPGTPEARPEPEGLL